MSLEAPTAAVQIPEDIQKEIERVKNMVTVAEQEYKRLRVLRGDEEVKIGDLRKEEIALTESKEALLSIVENLRAEMQKISEENANQCSIAAQKKIEAQEFIEVADEKLLELTKMKDSLAVLETTLSKREQVLNEKTQRYDEDLEIFTANKEKLRDLINSF
jgi:hypothetical protein